MVSFSTPINNEKKPNRTPQAKVKIEMLLDGKGGRVGRTFVAFAETGGANRDLPLGGAVDDSEDELFTMTSHCVQSHRQAVTRVGLLGWLYLVLTVDCGAT